MLLLNARTIFMDSTEKFFVEVAYALPNEQVLISLDVEQGTTAEQAVKLSGVLEKFPEIDFKMVCSKGTYIRSLVRDFGIVLNCGAYLKELKRTAIGSHRLEKAFSPEEIVNSLEK